MWRLRREKRVPWHLRTWKIVIEGETVELSDDVSVGAIRAKLPAELVEEFNECVDRHPLHYLVVELSVWNLPTEKLLAYRREMAARLYRSMALNPDTVQVPENLDVNAIMRSQGECLLGTHPDLLPVWEEA